MKTLHIPCNMIPTRSNHIEFYFLRTLKITLIYTKLMSMNLDSYSIKTLRYL